MRHYDKWLEVPHLRNEVSKRNLALHLFVKKKEKERRRWSSRDPFTRGEKSFEYKGTINATVPFSSVPRRLDILPLPCCGNPAIKERRNIASRLRNEVIAAKSREKGRDLRPWYTPWPKITDRASPKSRKNVWKTGGGRVVEVSRASSRVSEELLARITSSPGDKVVGTALRPRPQRISVYARLILRVRS